MSSNDDLFSFVKDALGRGTPRPVLTDVLSRAGWQSAQINATLGSFADVDFPIPVPRPRQYLSARDASLRGHRLKLYVRNSIWVFPVLSVFAGLLSVAVVNRLDRALGLEVDVSPDTARTVIGTVAGSMFTLVVVSSSAILVTVQLASAQLTPRIVTLVYRSRIRKFCISAFVFTFTFSVGALVRIENNAPLLTSYAAAYGFLISEREMIPPSRPTTATLVAKVAVPEGYRPRGAAIAA